MGVIMSECCSSPIQDKPKSAKLECPVCNKKNLSVQLKTILHHIKKPWTHTLNDEAYYYCSNPNCNIVYFTESAIVINKSDIRSSIGIKEQSADALICFCFGISKEQAESSKIAKDFVIKQTKNSLCSCNTANPSGRCCLKDFHAHDPTLS